MSLDIKIKKDLGDFKLDVEVHSQSKRIGILGASGCGKSMTLKSIAGVETVDEGYIRINDTVFLDTSKKINQKPQKRKVGYLFQNYALFPNMNVKENIMAGLTGDKAQNNARAKEMIDKFQLTGLEKRLPAELSGGQQQRTALARIMAYKPDMLLLDEPFSALDLYLKDRMMLELMQMLESYEGIVILVSHSRDEIYQFSEQLVIMDKGKVICAGDTKERFQNPESVVAARLTGCKNIAAIEKIDKEIFRIKDWNVEIHMSKEIPDWAQFIGYRAHQFLPIWGEQPQNSIPFSLNDMSELPFEKRYFIKGNECEDICWFLQTEGWRELEERGMPDFLQFREEDILFLREK